MQVSLLHSCSIDQLTHRFQQTVKDTFNAVIRCHLFPCSLLLILDQQVGEKVQEMGSGASKEANKNVAKSDEASIGTKATAAKDAVFDKKVNLAFFTFQTLSSSFLSIG